MFKKNFISLYFLSDKILILKLDSSRKKVKKFATLDLPEGLIKNYKVSDKALLAKVLKNAWSKLHLRERSIGIVIPEFSTFTKLFSLPKLKPLEMDEAVRWQAQDFLPSTPEEMIMDWKIVEEKEDGYEVLVVAMNKQILGGFVESAESAGLFPLSVETPSICLARVFLKNEQGGTLLLYKMQNEALLAISSKEKIYGTSVVHFNDLEKIISTASKITNHYKQVKVEKILLGGEVDEDLISSLEDKLGRKTEWMKLNISGISKEEMQKYLIAACMQLSDLQEPSDPYSLNLLPLQLVDKYKRAKLNLQTWGLTLMITFFVWISFFATLGSYLFLGQRVTELKKKNLSKQSVFKQREEAIKQVKFINEISDRVLRIKKITVPPQNIFNDINEARPQGIVLSEYRMDLDLGVISLKGMAANRNDLVNFKKNLEANSDIGSVDVPISSFETESNIDFGLAFKYIPLISSGASNN